MKIYYVSKACQAKGPAFLRLAGKDYLEEGDICIVDTDRIAIAYLLTNEQRTWGQCKVIEKRPLTIDSGWSNFLVYSYDGFNGRKGDIRALEILDGVFKQTVLEPLFEEVIAILKFKKDHIDASVIHTVYQSAFESHIKPEEKVEVKKLEKIGQKKYFISFLKLDIIEKIRAFIVPKTTEKEIVAMIKNTFPIEFRLAFIEYNRFYPGCSIQEGLIEYFHKEIYGVESESGMEKMSDKKYVEIFRNLNVNKRGGKISPHKPILMLAVMELVEKGEIVSPFIPICRELEKSFKKIWEKYVPAGEGHNCAMQYPFFFMQSEQFWRLEALPWHEEKASYTLKELRKNYYGAIIDNDLFKIFCDQSQRNELRRIIIDTYFKAETSTLLNVKNEKKEPLKNSQVEVGVNSSLKGDECVVSHDLAAESSVKYRQKGTYKIIEYSDKSIAVYVEDKKLIAQFKGLGGYYCTFLKEGPCWIFPKEIKENVENLLRNIEIERESGLSEMSGRSNLLSEIQSEVALKQDELPLLQGNAKDKCLESLLVNVRKTFNEPDKYVKILVFLLTVLDGIKYGLIKGNNIYPLTKLSVIFNENWIEYKQFGIEYDEYFYQAFAAFGKTAYFKLEISKKVKLFSYDVIWTKTKVLNDISYGVLKQKWYELFKDEDSSCELSIRIRTILKNHPKLKPDPQAIEDALRRKTTSKLKISKSSTITSINEEHLNIYNKLNVGTEAINAVHVVYVDQKEPVKDLMSLINRLNPDVIFGLNIEVDGACLLEANVPITGTASHLPLKNGYWMKKGLELHQIIKCINKIFKKLEKDVEIRMK